MKRILIALALLASTAGAAQAQYYSPGLYSVFYQSMYQGRCLAGLPTRWGCARCDYPQTHSMPGLELKYYTDGKLYCVACPRGTGFNGQYCVAGPAPGYRGPPARSYSPAPQPYYSYPQNPQPYNSYSWNPRPYNSYSRYPSNYGYYRYYASPQRSQPTVNRQYYSAPQRSQPAGNPQHYSAPLVDPPR
jgi:hypothetical protein